MEVSKLNEVLNEKLKSGIVQFAYKKKNGNIRYAKGTTNLENVPENLHPSGKMESSNDSKRYYDVDANGWRSFIVENLVHVDGVGFSDDFCDLKNVVNIFGK